MSGFEVLHGGVFATVQDLGRKSCTQLGITPSGAMDEYAYLWTQKLLDNKEANALEILLSGLKLQATASTVIAVCGADLDFRINGSPAPVWQTHPIKSGDILSFVGKKEGMRAYLSVKEGFHINKYEDCFSTTLREHKGKKLEKGDMLPYTQHISSEIRRVPPKYIPIYPAELTLHIVAGYQYEHFPEEHKKQFFSTPYKLTPQISRMGYKLQGEPVTPANEGIISEGITFGAVQIPPDGQPIILLKERQTIGGYPKIGSVLPIDCFKLAQLPVKGKIIFKNIKVEDAQKMMQEFYRFFT